MSAKRVIGIDFGTSNSVVRVKRYGDDGQPFGDRLFVSNVLFDGNDNVPTLVQIPDDVEITPGLELEEEDCEFGRSAAVEQPGMTTYRNFKTDLESPDAGARMRACWLTRQFLRYIYRQYQAQAIHLGGSLDEELVYVSYPAKYSEENRQFMIGAARDAGFPNVRGITEPEAAVKAFLIQGESDLRQKALLKPGKASYLLFLDMGAGTTDLAVCKYEEGRTKIISTWPDDHTNIYFGGKDIDQVLNGYVEAYLRVNSHVVPEYFMKHFGEKYIDAVKAWKEVTVSRTLKRNKSVPYFSAVKNPYPNLPDFSPPIGREEFETACGDYLRGFPELVNGCLAHTKQTDPDFPGGEGIDLVLLTGGHSQWYFIPEILAGKQRNFGSVILPKIQADPARIRLSGKPQEMAAVGMAYELLETGDTDTPPVRNLPDKVLTRKIAEQKFLAVRNVIVPEGYTAIGMFAFPIHPAGGRSAIPQVETVVLPEGLQHIGAGSFSQCSKLRSINFPDGLLTIGEGAFRFSSSLESAVIPGSVRQIECNTFEQCKSLRTVTLGYGIDKIKSYAFSRCYSLTSITIPGSVKIISNFAFRNCKNLITLNLEYGIEDIGQEAFLGCALTSITIPGSVKIVRGNAFSLCPQLKIVTVEEGVQKIETFAFDQETITIRCKSGSYAEHFAREHGIKLEII